MMIGLSALSRAGTSEIFGSYGPPYGLSGYGMAGNSYASVDDPGTVLMCPPCSNTTDVQAIVTQTLAATIVASIVSSVMNGWRRK